MILLELTSEIPTYALYGFFENIITLILSIGGLGTIAIIVTNRYFKKLDNRIYKQDKQDAERAREISDFYGKINELINRVDVLVSQLADHKQYDEEFRSTIEERIKTACAKIAESKRIQKEHYKELHGKVHNFEKLVEGLKGRIIVLEKFINK